MRKKSPGLVFPRLRPGLFFAMMGARKNKWAKIDGHIYYGEYLLSNAAS